MKALNLHRITFALLLTMALGLVGCRDAHESATEDMEDPYATRLQVTIRVSGGQGFGTRAAGPYGGEDGDGREPGTNHENDVDNATLLLYQDADGINSTQDPIIRHAFYAPHLTGTKTTEDGKYYIVYTSEVLRYERPIDPGTYHVIALVNMGDRTDLQGKTLNEVRDLQETAPYTLTYDATTGVPDIKNADNFVMTSATDATITISGEGGPNNVKNVQADVERLAARIDFSPGPLADAEHPQDKDHAQWVTKEVTLQEGGTKELTGYEYVVVDAPETNNATADRFILTHVTPFNCLDAGTYLFKRVSTDGTTPTYLGDETKDGADNATNYVLDPWTSAKTTGASPAGLTWRNRLESEDVRLESGLWPVKYGDDILFTPTVANPSNLKYYILDYTQENTLPAAGDTERFATGLQFNGYYGMKQTDGTLKYFPRSYRCYIRHSDPAGIVPEDAPMKYGIVRNNIYRIHISRVNSLGRIEIVVQKWNPINVDKIIL